MRQAWLTYDANHNGLPDDWEFTHGLENPAGRVLDSDSDGWSDFQEWQADSLPDDATDTPLGRQPTAVSPERTLPFAATRQALILIIFQDETNSATKAGCQERQNIVK